MPDPAAPATPLHSEEGRIRHVSKWYAEDLVDLTGFGPVVEWRSNPPDNRSHHETRDGLMGRHCPKDLDIGTWQADFFLGLSKCRSDRIGVLVILLSTRESNLAWVVFETRRSFCQYHRKPAFAVLYCTENPGIPQLPVGRQNGIRIQIEIGRRLSGPVQGSDNIIDPIGTGHRYAPSSGDRVASNPSVAGSNS